MVSNQLAVIQQGASPVDFAQKMALAYASIVGCTPDQGVGIALTGYCEGLNPVEFKRRYHWIPGKGPSMRADAMLAEFRMNYGGEYKLGICNGDEASVTFFDRAKNEYPRKMTKRQLLLSRNPWKKDPGWAKMVPEVQRLISTGQTDDQIIAAVGANIGDNYGTPFDWENMLFARLVSQSLRKICPELAAGIYTPEEMYDVIEGEVVSPPAKVAKTVDQLLDEAARQAVIDAPREPMEILKPFLSTVAGVHENSDEMSSPFEPAIDGEFTVTSSDAPIDNAKAGYVTRITSLANQAWPTATDRNNAIEMICRKRGVSALSLLTNEQAKEVIDRLEATIANSPT